MRRTSVYHCGIAGFRKPAAMTDDQIRMNRLSLRFADARLEASFTEEQARKSLRPIRIALISVATLMAIMSLVVIYRFPYLLASGMRMHRAMVVVLGLCAAFYAASHMPSFLRLQQQLLVIMVCMLAAMTIFPLGRIPLDILATRGYVIMVVHTFTIYGLFRMRFPAAAAAAWLSAGMYFGYLINLDLLAGLDLARHAAVLIIANVYGMLICYQMDLATRRAYAAMRQLVEEREHSERLLLNILPKNVIQELAGTGKVKPARHENASILFTDFASFTQATSTMPADRMVAELNEIFAAFDDIVREGGIEKIKTIGDAYMAAAGLSDNLPNHAELCARAALRMIAFMEERNRTAAFKWQLRVGIHSGPVVSGVVGKHKYAYDIWGDAVNIASRMESSGESGRVNVSAYTYDLIRSLFACTYRGKISAKGKGEIDMYFVDTANTTAVG